MPYDYKSVMHYSANVAMQSLPEGIHDADMGQRNDFSPLDVVQLRDMRPALACFGANTK